MCEERVAREKQVAEEQAKTKHGSGTSVLCVPVVLLCSVVEQKPLCGACCCDRRAPLPNSDFSSSTR